MRRMRNLGLVISALLAQSGVAAAAPQPGSQIDMKLLVIGADGNEPSFGAAKATLSRLGVPFDTLLATEQDLTPALLATGNHARYQGIVLTTSNLAYYNSVSATYESALSAAEWSVLWQYEADFAVRQVTMYTFPTADYGFNAPTSGTGVPYNAKLTTAGATIFPYLRAGGAIPVSHTWTYRATALDTTMQSLLTDAEGNVLAGIKTYPDGRQNLAFTMDGNQHQMHSVLLGYGIVNWVTKGVFLGDRHVFMDPQVDDVFLADNIWDAANKSDETGLEYRMNSWDAYVTTLWEYNTQRLVPNAQQLTMTMAYNAFGATGNGGGGAYNTTTSLDTLTSYLRAYKGYYKWVSHTWDHENMDNLTAAQTLTELQLNHQYRQNVALPNYTISALLTPEHSGLCNTAAMQAAYAFGIRYVVLDTSKHCNSATPIVPAFNTISPNLVEPRILEIPRYPNNLYYNVSTPAEWVSEYNHFYGPASTIRPTWDHNLTYEEILDKESDGLVKYMLTYDMNPIMFHQSNLRAYDAVHTLLTDLLDRTLSKYNAYYNLPIRSPHMATVAGMMSERKAYDNANVSGVITVGQGISIASTADATVPVSGILYGTRTENYGGKNTSKFVLNGSNSRLVNIPVNVAW